ncbi:choice-of-anchor J domain-containing protein [Marinifilum sp. D737]|uniref:choice-of-anchor J domain-containing protein n=1 Tax=Marinifilum sp. D737 TaxID=2969628 RepID=UPI002273CFC4|nr:choice-of-anchor J domain-containing protein [Marinifilum sp. D737]MCY1634317.1 choice-of-anchor J domain-containing protein [Marinifilum sp. D737]
MNIAYKNITRKVSAAMLVSLLFFGTTAMAGDKAPKNKNKGKVTIFEDGWQELKAVEGEPQTGNFTAISVEGEPVQSDNKKWTSGWGNWSVNGKGGNSKRGVIMVPNRSVNDDWLVSEEIELANCKKAELVIEAYSKYGTDSANELKVLISDNYNGDVEAAQWDELWMESIHKQNQAVERKISLKKYMGKSVVIAFRSIHSGKSVKNMTRTTFLSNVKVTAIRK